MHTSSCLHCHTSVQAPARMEQPWVTGDAHHAAMYRAEDCWLGTESKLSKRRVAWDDEGTEE